jgi:oligopeptide transport system ATP-binding protein
MQRTLGITFIIISHDIVQAMHVSDRIGMLYSGKLLEYAPVDQFLQTRHRKVREFLERNVTLPNVPDEQLLDP